MILTIDIGNTNIKIGLYGNELCGVLRLATEPNRTAVQYAAEIMSIFSLEKIDLGDITGGIISSVVPSLTNKIKTAVIKVFGIEPMVLSEGINTGLNLKIDNPKRLGADLIAGAAGAVGKYPLPCVIYDLGTATTVTVLDKNGDFIGGSILAGVNISLAALASETAQLPPVSLSDAPAGVINKNTRDSMLSGAVFGTAAAIDVFAKRIEGELGSSVTTVATGGIAKFILPHCRREVVYDENLMMRGLANIYRLNA